MGPFTLGFDQSVAVGLDGELSGFSGKGVLGGEVGCGAFLIPPADSVGLVGVLGFEGKVVGGSDSGVKVSEGV